MKNGRLRLPVKLIKLIRLFRGDLSTCGPMDWNTPKGAWGNCEEASVLFCQFLDENRDEEKGFRTRVHSTEGYLGSLNDGDPRYLRDFADCKDDLGHYIASVKVDRRLIFVDWTARQFDATHSYPLILDVAGISTLWRHVEDVNVEVYHEPYA